MKDQGQLDGVQNLESLAPFVFPNDAEDIKAHRWFKGVPWEHLHTLTPPFIPHIHGAEDTHYFDESEPVTDWSESSPSLAGLSPSDVRVVLSDYRTEVQDLAVCLVATSYDSAKLRGLDKQIDSTASLTMEEKEVLKHFVRFYGKKERKRPRDRLLRDGVTKDVVMGVRKRTAFLGYTWRRMQPLEASTPKYA
jgi:hypothetical protein